MRNGSIREVFKTIPKEIGIVAIIIFVAIGGFYVTDLRSNVTTTEYTWKNFGSTVENGKTHWKKADNLLKDNLYHKAEEKYLEASLKFENVAGKASKYYIYLNNHELLKEHSSLQNLKNYWHGSENAYRATKIMIQSIEALQEKKIKKAENLRKIALKHYQIADNHFGNIQYL